MGGTYQGDEVECWAVDCPAPLGACCLANGNCLELSQGDCTVIPGSSWPGLLTGCYDADNSGEADDCEVHLGFSADFDRDGDVDLSDYDRFLTCMAGSDSAALAPCCEVADLDHDTDIDIGDFSKFQALFMSP